jgi:lysophospholipase L1-like esterase
MWCLRLWQHVSAILTWRRPGDRRRTWLLSGLALGLLLALTFGAGGQAQAVSNNGRDMNYLALGDSVTFGFNPLVDPRNAANFVAYPDFVAHRLDEHLTNAACPGVTSSRFISLSGPDWLCEDWLNHGFPLHVTYHTSQLQFAVAFLKSHPHTRLVTLLIGANDLYRLQGMCNNDTTCIVQGLPGVLATFRANLDTIYATLRHNAHYHHQIVTLTYYSPDYRNQLFTGSIIELNKVIENRAAAWGSQVADGFRAFGIASGFGDPCAAGLLIRTSPSTCDVHPSREGHMLLAQIVLAVVHRNVERDDAA